MASANPLSSRVPLRNRLVPATRRSVRPADGSRPTRGWARGVHQ
jgi:hypothetical protein